MEKYKILYYTWREITYQDAIEVLEKLGHSVVVCDTPFEKYDEDEKLISSVKTMAISNQVDLIFSFGYVPDLSRIANEIGIRYVSWVYDSPNRTMDSVTLKNTCNQVNVFDSAMCEKYKSMGFDTVRYMPLACNVKRVQNLVRPYFNGACPRYEHDITFLGTLYADEFNFFDQIEYLQPYLRGYIDAAMECQKNLFGIDMIGLLIDDTICNEMKKYVKLDMGANYRDCQNDILVSMIQKKLTVKERKDLLTVLGEYYKVDHYAGTKTEGLPVQYKGYATYETDMPRIFASSKINLNISLRSILTGIPLRVIDILGAAGFCISNYQEELSWYFENDKSIVWYEDYEDLFAKVDFYLRHESRREQIALCGHEIVKQQFTYEYLLPKVLMPI